MTAVPAIPETAALLLDLDGTLIDFAPTPDAVIVPPGLPEALHALRRRYGDAVAIVTGRPIAQVDTLLPGVPYAVAGEHGAAIRHAPGEPIRQPLLPVVPAAWAEQADAAVARYPGALLERKRHGFAVHYRRAPEADLPLHALLTEMMAGNDGDFALLAAHMAWEVKPRGADKGRAVASLMAHPPFAGRVPVYVGDDVTDEDGMREARARGGIGLRVQDAFGTPAAVRAWLAALAGSSATT